jgi:hypothetical protein
LIIPETPFTPLFSARKTNWWRTLWSRRHIR